jgi:DNA transformation protein
MAASAAMVVNPAATISAEMSRTAKMPRAGPPAATAADSGWAGLGPKSRAALGRVGVTTLEQLRAADAVQLYLQVKAQWPAASMNLLYALAGAQESRHWREIARERRTELLLRLDDLGAAP